MELPETDPIELEIAAFMGPHIKRTRIALVLIGIIYGVVAYLYRGDIERWRRDLVGIGDYNLVEEIERRIDTAHKFIIFTGIVGVASIILAAIPGKATAVAIYIATALFFAHSAFQLYLVGPIMFASWLWWLSAIVIGMGFEAAYKANRLRRRHVPAEMR